MLTDLNVRKVPVKTKISIKRSRSWIFWNISLRTLPSVRS